MDDSTYTVELSLTPLVVEPDSAGAVRRFDLMLIDREYVNELRQGSAELRLDAPLPGHERTVQSFLDDFRAGARLTLGEGLAFGRWLLDTLFDDPPLRHLWRQISARIPACPLRLLLVLERGDAQRVADLPFELLADEIGFIFRRSARGGRHVLVRTLRSVRLERFQLHPGARVLVAWANPSLETQPPGMRRLSDKLLESHETAIRESAAPLGFEVLEPCRSTSYASLAHQVQTARPVPLVSLIAHGMIDGGGLLLHDERHPDYPDDPGRLVSARDIATAMREGGTRVALLWSCYSGVSHPDYGAVAEALLDPLLGDLVAVLASHCSVRARETPDLARRILETMCDSAEGSLEQGVAQARHLFGEEDLQWAALVYYARPGDNESVTANTDDDADAAGSGAGRTPSGLERMRSPVPQREEIARPSGPRGAGSSPRPGVVVPPLEPGDQRAPASAPAMPNRGASPRPLARWAALAAILALCVLLRWAGWFESLDRSRHDTYVLWFSAPIVDSQVAIVDLSDRVARWPWSRRTLERLMERLLHGARVSGLMLDVVLSDEPLEGEPESEFQAANARIAAIAKDAREDRNQSVVIALDGALELQPPPDRGVRLIGTTPLPPELRSLPAGFAALLGSQQPYGQVRSAALFARAERPAGAPFLFSLAVLGAARGAQDLQINPERPAIGFNGSWIVTNSSFSIELPPVHDELLTVVDAADILSGDAVAPQLAGILRGALVVLGRYTDEPSDVRAVALPNATGDHRRPGVAIQAALVSALRQGRHGRRWDPEFNVLLQVSSLLLVALAWEWRTKSWQRCVIAWSAAALTFTLEIYALHGQKIWIDGPIPELAALCGGATWQAARHMVGQRRRPPAGANSGEAQADKSSPLEPTP